MANNGVQEKCFRLAGDESVGHAQQIDGHRHVTGPAPPMTSHFLCPVQGCMPSRQKVQKGSHGRPCRMVFIRRPRVVLPVAWNPVRSDVE
jgi:hypothetical protein